MVLIPLVQGRFLFTSREINTPAFSCLNPFGSGTFFIREDMSALAELMGLNPFGSGTFFIPRQG